MKTLILFVLAGENMRARYEAAMRDAGVDMSKVDLLLALPGAGSARNARYVLDASGPGTRLERLARKMGAMPLDRYGHIILASFSAGYGAVREVLEDPASAARVSGYAAIDSVHDGLSLGRLDWFVRFAEHARDGEAVLHLGFTDVPTPKRGANAYSSTTQVATELAERVGLGLPASNASKELGGLRLESHDHHPPSKAAAEHSAALTDWGARLLARCVVDVHALLEEPEHDEAPLTIPQRTEQGDRGAAVMMWQTWLREQGYYMGTIDGVPGPVTEAATDAYERQLRIVKPLVFDLDYFADLPLAERGVAWCGVELGADPREIPGDQHDPRILSYSRHCRRGGNFLGVDKPGDPLWIGGAPLPLGRDEDAWCAAFASACLLGSLLPGEKPPHGLRVSVRELVEDARKAGTWHAAGSGYRPKTGDRAVFGRLGERPDRGGRGHVSVVRDVDGEAMWTIGGNEGNRVQHRERKVAEALGWIEVKAA